MEHIWSFFGRAVVERVAKEAADKYGADFGIYSNVEISGDAQKHELDLVFRTGIKHLPHRIFVRSSTTWHPRVRMVSI